MILVLFALAEDLYECDNGTLVNMPTPRMLGNFKLQQTYVRWLMENSEIKILRKNRQKLSTTVIFTFCPDIFTHILMLLYAITQLLYSLYYS